MLLNILILVIPVIIINLKSWFHWQYLREVDHKYKIYKSLWEYSRSMSNHRLPTLGGLGQNSYERFQSGQLFFLIFPTFSKYQGVKHSKKASLYVKIIYALLVAFYFSVAVFFATFSCSN